MHAFKPWIVLLVLLHSQGSNQAHQPPIITKFAPKDLVNRNEVNFREPNSLKLPCETSGSNLTWTWKHNGTVINETRGVSFSLSKDGTLTGSYLSTEHSGTYQCFVKDRITGVEVFSRKLQVAVTVVGKFTNTRGVVKKIVLGQPFSFQCPEHTPSYGAAYNWVGNGNHWIQFSKNKRRGISPDGGLYISYVTKKDIDEIRDEKGIKCRISGANKFQESGILKLEKKNAGNSDPGTLRLPSWAVVPASEEIAIEGRSKTLYCFATGRPTPKITWKKNGQPITHGQNSFKIRSFFYGRRLYINNVNRTEHQDRYSCQAENSQNNGRPLIHTINLLVEVAPRWTVGPPSQKISLAIGGNGSLECQVTAVPAAKITWYKNGQQLKLAKSHVTVDGHKLHLRDVNHIHDGVYQCVAENRHGMIVSATWVHVQVVPALGLFLDKKPSVWERGNIVGYSLVSMKGEFLFKSNTRDTTSTFRYPSLLDKLYLDKIPKWSALTVAGKSVLVEVRPNEFQTGKMISWDSSSDGHGGKVTVKTQKNTKEFDYRDVRIKGMDICQFDEVDCDPVREDCHPVHINKWLAAPARNFTCSCKEGYQIHGPTKKCIALTTTIKPTDHKSIDDHTMKNVAEALVEKRTVQKESKSNIGVILGSLCAALGVVAIVAFVLWKKFVKRMTSDERLRKEVIEEMEEKWKEENPHMNIQEKRSKLSNYLLLFRSIPLKVKDRIREFSHRRSAAQAPTDIMHNAELFDHVTKEGQGDHQQENSNLDTQGLQGDHEDTQEPQGGLHQRLSHEDTQEHQGDLHQTLSHEDTQEHQGDLHQRLSHEDTQEHQGDVHQRLSHEDTQEHHSGIHQRLSHEGTQEHQGAVHQTTQEDEENSHQDTQEIQEDQENLHQESSLQDTQQYQHPHEPLRQEDICQEDPRQDPQEDQEKLQQERSPQDKVEKD